MDNNNLTQKLWGFCNTLRHDGVDSSDYIEQLTYLLFLKLADERQIAVPENCRWETFLTQADENLIPHLENVLSILQHQEGILHDIFEEPVSKINKPETLRKLIKLIDDIQWNSYDADIVGLAFEELLGKVANEGKKGAGQYFTPRPLIRTIVNVIKPNPLETKDFTICDVASGTAGFLTVAYEYQKEQNRNKKISKKDVERIQKNTYFGQELVVRPRRLALMNMFLHGVFAHIKLGDSIEGKQDNVLYNCILTNPPFGNKGSNQIPKRTDFAVPTSDKQLNFVQHIISKLKPDGRAAIVLPDSVLTDDKATDIWRNILQTCNLHTILKLPRGTFAAYANGIKAVVLFLQKGKPTEDLWIYDNRTNIENVTKKNRPLSAQHFTDFELCYGTDANGLAARTETDRFRKYNILQIKENNYELDFRWLKEDILLDSDEIFSPKDYLDELQDINEKEYVVLRKLYELVG